MQYFDNSNEIANFTAHMHILPHGRTLLLILILLGDYHPLTQSLLFARGRRRTMKWGVGSGDGSDWNLKHNSIGLALDGWWLWGWCWDWVALPVIGPYIHVGTSIPERNKRVAYKASGSEWASREYISVSPSKKHWQGLLCGWSPVVALHVLHSLLSSAV